MLDQEISFEEKLEQLKAVITNDASVLGLSDSDYRLRLKFENPLDQLARIAGRRITERLSLREIFAATQNVNRAVDALIAGRKILTDEQKQNPSFLQRQREELRRTAHYLASMIVARTPDSAPNKITRERASLAVEVLTPKG